MMRSRMMCLALVAAAMGATGCSYSTVEPGHRGLYFEPNGGGLQRQTLQPGKYKLGWCFLYCTPNRVDDFDVTYSTRSEDIATKSSEGLELTLKLSVIYRPIVDELYQLDTEIGPQYYDEVIGPEFRSACRGVFARHSYTELQKRNESIENEVEAEVRRRTAGKHVEISSVTLEQVSYAPEIAEKIRQKIAAAQETDRQLAAIDSEEKMALANAEKTKKELAEDAEKKKLALANQTEEKKAELQAESDQKKMELQKEAEQQKLELQSQSEMAKFKADQQLATMEVQKKAAKAEAEVAKLQAQTAAQTKIIEARADAEAARALAVAHAEENKAQHAGVTPMEVMIHAYDALAHLGGTGTTIVLGDWAHVPHFLFPRVPSLNSAFTLPYMPMIPAAPPATAALPGGGGSVYSDTK
jgi:regulator of protease activity HflC (stomatin/prohibitin superfamily)